MSAANQSASGAQACRYPDCDCEPPCNTDDCVHCDGTTPCIHCGSDPLPPESSADSGASK